MQVRVLLQLPHPPPSSGDACSEEVRSREGSGKIQSVNAHNSLTRKCIFPCVQEKNAPDLSNAGSRISTRFVAATT